MHIRALKNRAQIFRYQGYSPEKKRGVSEYVGSLPLSSQEVPDELKGLLSDEELQEVKEWILTYHAEQAEKARMEALEQLPHSLSLSAALVSGDYLDPNSRDDQELAEKVFRGLSQMRHALEKAGFKDKQEEKR